MGLKQQCGTAKKRDRPGVYDWIYDRFGYSDQSETNEIRPQKKVYRSWIVLVKEVRVEKRIFSIISII